MARKSKPVARPADLLTPYTRVSSGEQAESGAGLSAQEKMIVLGAEMRGIRLTSWTSDPGFSGKDMERPGLQKALAMVAAGESGGLIIAKLDRLSRSILDFASLVKQATAEGWNIVCLDPWIDLKSPNGKMLAGILMVIAEWERDIIGQRTREGLAAKREAGVRLGRPALADDDLLATVFGMFQETGGYAQTARALNSAKIATATGSGAWYPGTVRNLMFSQDGTAYSSREEVAA